MQNFTYNRATTFHVPASKNENKPLKFQKDEPKNNAFPARVFGTEISNLGKPVKPITRSKNTLTTQNNLNVKPMEISTSNNEVNLTNCYFHPQQVQMKSMQIEEEDVEIEDSSKKLEDPQYISGYVKEIFAYLRDMEHKSSIKTDYMSRNQKDINEKMRGILIDWIVDVHLKFKLRPETLFITVNLIDRYLEKVTILRSKLQLVGVSSMLIACKYEEIYAPEIKDFVYITDKAYTKEEILEMEGNILNTLDFNLTCNSSLIFMERYASLLNFDEKMMMFGRYLIELTLIEYKMIKYLPSMIACSTLYLINKIQKKELWPAMLEKNCKYSENELKICSKEILLLLQNVDKSNLQAVKKKFALPKFLEISKYIQEKN